MSKNYSQDIEAPLLGGNPLVDDYRFQRYRRVAKASLWISVIALIFSFAAFHRGVIITSNEADTTPAAAISTFELEELSYTRCVDPSITDTYTFTVPVDEYHGLITDEHLHHSVIHFEGGHASVRVNPAIKDIIVRYEIQYQFEEDKDHIRIESRDAENEQGVRHITFIVDDDDNDHHHRHCLVWDLTIELPTEDALEKLSIGVANHNVGLYDAFTFDRLSIGTANGNIQYHTQGVVASSSSLSTANGNIIVNGATSTTKSSFSTANGNVQAQFDRLEGSHASSTSSGNINFSASAIGNESSEKDTVPTTISLSSSAGSIDATVPDSFHSKFTANTVLGKAIVRSEEHPEKIHFKSQGRFSKHGYYGDSENDIQDGNRISASTTVGHAFITYA
ncbi:predicted protein [Lichtheimia corymbifera JMRC:FSU:9682]|uniref:Uncharacterized protein n=1 Tax=Lichtheimia corymbifera JMRC:FSU:9682 TaxID=1263082 RepID=A0A068SE04_9FUNG|nr:predicted protein [Lichtheimia corymbifera JMRC:FSU:9682]